LVGGDGENDLFGDKGDDTLTGGSDADSFSCGPGTDTITDFNEAEGDTKTADCENLLYDISVSNDDNATIGNFSAPSNETVVEDFMPTNEEDLSDALTATMITTRTRSSNNETTTAPEERE
jgi:Ca2+-binding RTX toxin-like protein